MDPKAALIAAKLTGRLETIVALGRLDYVGRFQPFGTQEVVAAVRLGEDGLWVARVENARVTFSHDSPRIITHGGMLLYNGWVYDALPVGSYKYYMRAGETATFTVEYPLPETL